MSGRANGDTVAARVLREAANYKEIGNYRKIGAGEEDRTLDIHLGKVALYR